MVAFALGSTVVPIVESLVFQPLHSPKFESSLRLRHNFALASSLAPLENRQTVRRIRWGRRPTIQIRWATQLLYLDIR